VTESGQSGESAGHNRTWLVVLLYLAVATAAGHVDYHIRAYPERGFAEYTPGLLAGTEHPPGRYRVLAPYLYEGLRQATGLEPRSAWIVFRWLSLLGALFAAHAYLGAWFRRGPSVAGTLLMTVLLPLTFTNSWAHPDHLLELGLFTLACACLARGWTAWFAVALVANALNRETSAFLVPLFLLSGAIDRRRLEATAAMALLWASTYVGLRAWLGFQPYDPWQWTRNLEFLALLPANYDLYYRAYAWFVVIMLLPLVAATAVAWPSLPRMVRVGGAVITPVFLVTAMLFSSVIETRIFTPLLPLVAPAVVFALFPDERPADR
jgi:hypothetical protein